MKKFFTLLIIILIGCLMAGLYGIIHDQLTYTISSEYYTKFKFYQFGLASEGDEAIFSSPRLWVSVVGFTATWWTGIPVATILGLFSLDPDRKSMIAIAMKGFLVTITIAFLTGMYGLYEGFTYVADQPKENFRRWFVPENLVDFQSFIAVGSMHNYSYLGGFYGLFFGIAYIGWRRGMIKIRKKATW
jgi:hypothetical protein